MFDMGKQVKRKLEVNESAEEALKNFKNCRAGWKMS